MSVSLAPVIASPCFKYGLAGLLFVWHLAVFGTDSLWVRVMVGSPHEIRALSNLELANYGSHAWGQVSPDELADLRRQGLIVSVQDDPFTLQLGGERFDPLVTSFNPRTAHQSDPTGDYYLVQLVGPTRASWLQALRESGVKLVQPLHPFSHVVWASETAIAAARGQAEVR